MANSQLIDFSKHLNISLSENPVFAKLFSAFQEELESGFYHKLTQLRRLRSSRIIHRGDTLVLDGERYKVEQAPISMTDPTSPVTVSDNNGAMQTITMKIVHEREILIAVAHGLGFDYYSDTLTNYDYLRIIETIMKYWDFSGSSQFMDYVGYIKQTRMTIHQLYDSTLFSGSAYQDLITDEGLVESDYHMNGGVFYPTSSYVIRIDGLLHPTFDMEDVIGLFYFFGSTNLVLRVIETLLTAPMDIGVAVPISMLYSEGSTLEIHDD